MKNCDEFRKTMEYEMTKMSMPMPDGSQKKMMMPALHCQNLKVVMTMAMIQGATKSCQVLEMNSMLVRHRLDLHHVFFDQESE
jgi:hypothetical protein